MQIVTERRANHPSGRHNYWESEADDLGLMLRTRSGYNPQVAVGCRQKMSAQGGKQPKRAPCCPSQGNKEHAFL